MGEVLIPVYMCAYVCTCMRVYICDCAHISVWANAQAWAQVLALQAASIQQLFFENLLTAEGTGVKKYAKIPARWDLLF